MLDKKTKKKILEFQKNEITEHHIYEKLSRIIKDKNRKILQQISQDELKHHNFWKEQTGEDVKPDNLRIWWYYIISRIFGITFGIKLMEKGEEGAQEAYGKIVKIIPGAKKIMEDEEEHEQELVNLIDEERLRYVGSMVLGLNDALVELTGALAGLTLAFQNARLIAVAGLVTGIAASFSMAASEYLSTKSEGGTKDPLKASIYTGFAYIITVILLIFPFLVLDNIYASLGLTVFNAILVILVFTFYISVAKDIPFKERFIEMAGISLGIAALSFVIGFVVRMFLGIEA